MPSATLRLPLSSMRLMNLAARRLLKTGSGWMTRFGAGPFLGIVRSSHDLDYGPRGVVPVPGTTPGNPRWVFGVPRNHLQPYFGFLAPYLERLLFRSRAPDASS